MIYKLTKRFGRGHAHDLPDTYFLDKKNAQNSADEFANKWASLTGVEVTQKSSGTWEEKDGWVLCRIEEIDAEDEVSKP